MEPLRREILLAFRRIHVLHQAALRRLRRQVPALHWEVVVEAPHGPGPKPGGA